MTTETTNDCECGDGMPAVCSDRRLGFHQCRCCGALLTATEHGEFPPHVHVTRFSDVVALPRMGDAR